MSASRLQRWLLLAFPPSFRARYGEELETLTSDCGRGWRTNADLAQAAAKAWLRPSFIGPPEETRRRRLESTTATVFVTWSLSCLAVAVFAKAVNDQPVPGLRSWGWTAYVIGSGLFELTVGGARLRDPGAGHRRDRYPEHPSGGDPGRFPGPGFGGLNNLFRSLLLAATLFGDEPAALCGDGTDAVAEHGLSALS